MIVLSAYPKLTASVSYIRYMLSFLVHLTKRKPRKETLRNHEIRNLLTAIPILQFIPSLHLQEKAKACHNYEKNMPSYCRFLGESGMFYASPIDPIPMPTTRQKSSPSIIRYQFLPLHYHRSYCSDPSLLPLPTRWAPPAQRPSPPGTQKQL